MTETMSRLLALVDLNGRTRSIHDQLHDAPEIAAVLHQAGEQIAYAVGLLLKAESEKRKAVGE